MLTDEQCQRWKQLHSNWIEATKHADKLEKDLMTCLRLCAGGEAKPPTHEVLDAFERARGKALNCRVQVELFVDKLFWGSTGTPVVGAPSYIHDARPPT